jgi:ankyrin repeat protein
MNPCCCCIEEAVFEAVRDSDFDLAKQILEQNPDFDVNTKSDNNLIHSCSALGNLEILRYLIEIRKADVNLRSEGTKETPILVAVKRRHLNIVQYLAENGANLDIQDPYGNTALFHSRNDITLELCKVLIEKGADLNVKNKGGQTVLAYAVKAGQYHLSELLITNGADLNMQNAAGMTVLMIAAEKNFLDVCKILVENGADVNIKDNNGRSAFVYTFHNPNSNISRFLIEKGAAFDVNDLAFAAHIGYLNACRFLEEKGVNLDAKDRAGNTALLSAARSPSPNSICKFLLEKGVNVNEKDADGNTAIMYISRNGHYGLFKRLCLAGAEIPPRRKMLKGSWIHPTKKSLFLDYMERDTLRQAIIIFVSGNMFKRLKSSLYVLPAEVFRKVCVMLGDQNDHNDR